MKSDGKRRLPRPLSPPASASMDGVDVQPTCFLIYSDRNDSYASTLSDTLRRFGIVVFGYPFELDPDLQRVRRASAQHDVSKVFYIFAFGATIVDQPEFTLAFKKLIEMQVPRRNERKRRAITVRLDAQPSKRIREESAYSGFNLSDPDKYDEQLARLVAHLGRNAEHRDVRHSVRFSHVSGLMETTAPQDQLFTDLKRQINDGHIDQKFLYWDVRAAMRWQKIAQSSTYMTAQASMNLVAASSSEVIEAAMGSSGDSSTFINFGVGTGQKDWAILREMLESNPARKVLYVPIDESLAMLQITIDQMQDLMSEYGDRLGVHFVLSNFDNVDRFSAMIGEEERSFFGPTAPRRLVGFLGGSLGNFKEEAVLEQVASLLENPGDRLLLDIEFVAGRTDEELSSNYGDRPMQDFLFGPIYDAEGVLPNSDDFSHEVVYESRSDVPQSRTIVGKVVHRNRSIELFTATKYLPSPFENFLMEFGFKIRAKTVSGEKTPIFGQYLLEYIQDEDD